MYYVSLFTERMLLTDIKFQLSILTYWIILILCKIQSIDADIREYCQFEVFNASCPRGSVILMEAARYGRMSIGKCADTDVYIGCVADVLREMDAICSGRPSCQVTIPDSGLHQQLPCPHDIMAYMEAGYMCIEANHGDNSCHVRGENAFVQDRPPGIYLTGTEGFLTSFAGQQYRHGTSSCPWFITVPSGQRVDLSVMDFSLGARYKDISGMSMVSSGSMTEYCHVYAVVKEADLAREFAVCAGKGREKHAYSSQTSSVSVELPDTFLTDKSVNFIIKYVATGCADMDAPRNAWVSRQSERVQVTCNHTQHTWHLICRGTQWIGDIGQASECDTGPSTEKMKNNRASFPTYGLIIAVVIGVIIGGLCGFSLLAVVLWCKRRAESTGRPKRGDLELVAQCDSPCKLHQRLNSGQYGYTQVWEVTSPQRPTGPGYHESMYGSGISSGGGSVYQQQTILPINTTGRKDHLYESPAVDGFGLVQPPYYCQGLRGGFSCSHGTLPRGSAHDWRSVPASSAQGRFTDISTTTSAAQPVNSPYSPSDETEEDEDKYKIKSSGQGYRSVPTVQDSDCSSKPCTENPYT